jgi:hypothetical protein
MKKVASRWSYKIIMKVILVHAIKLMYIFEGLFCLHV